MATCKECIHETVCSALIEKGLPWSDGEYPAEAFCMPFRNKNNFVEVVRCKDCIAREEFAPNKFHCTNTGYYCGETGYCSDGVRTPKERGGEK